MDLSDFTTTNQFWYLRVHPALVETRRVPLGIAAISTTQQWAPQTQNGKYTTACDCLTNMHLSQTVAGSQ